MYPGEKTNHPMRKAPTARKVTQFTKNLEIENKSFKKVIFD
jgi:hypothetical protein